MLLFAVAPPAHGVSRHAKPNQLLVTLAASKAKAIAAPSAPHCARRPWRSRRSRQSPAQRGRPEDATVRNQSPPYAECFAGRRASNGLRERRIIHQLPADWRHGTLLYVLRLGALPHQFLCACDGVHLVLLCASPRRSWHHTAVGLVIPSWEVCALRATTPRPTRGSTVPSGARGALFGCTRTSRAREHVGGLLTPLMSPVRLCGSWMSARARNPCKRHAPGRCVPRSSLKCAATGQDYAMANSRAPMWSCAPHAPRVRTSSPPLVGSRRTCGTPFALTGGQRAATCRPWTAPGVSLMNVSSQGLLLVAVTVRPAGTVRMASSSRLIGH